MKKILNTSFIAELSCVDEQETTPDGFYSCYSKGDPIFYFFPWFHKERYAKENYYGVLGSNKVYTKAEMIEMSAEEIKNDLTLVIKNGSLYKRPHVVITMSNGHVYRKFFTTFEECEVFAEDIRNKFVSSIELEIE